MCEDICFHICSLHTSTFLEQGALTAALVSEYTSVDLDVFTFFSFISSFTFLWFSLSLFLIQS